MQSEMVVGVFSKDLKSIAALQYIDLGPPPIKNVCPFVYKDALHLIDTYASRVYIVDIKQSDDNDSFVFTIRDHVTLTMRGVSNKDTRGSTCPVHLQGHTWGCLVHDVFYSDNVVSQTKTKLAYIHRWMEFDIETGVVTFISSPFFIVHFGIEFASGIAVNDSEKGLISIYAGIEDKYPIVVRTTLNDLRA
jgi:hypothetical protein